MRDRVDSGWATASIVEGRGGEWMEGRTRSACGAWVEMMCVWATGTRGRVAYLGFEKVMQR